MQRFNQAPQFDPRNPKPLECNLEYRKKNDEIYKEAIDLGNGCFTVHLPFNCEKPITLFGFIANMLNFADDIDIDALLNGKKDTRKNYQKVAIHSKNETKIHFEEPVKLSSKETCVILSWSKSKAYTKHYFYLSPDNESDGTIFKFPCKIVSTTEHTFKCLLFDRLDES